VKRRKTDSLIFGAIATIKVFCNMTFRVRIPSLIIYEEIMIIF
jgi:hypothetical protein